MKIHLKKIIINIKLRSLNKFLIKLKTVNIKFYLAIKLKKN